MRWWRDGGGLRLNYEASLATWFESEFELLHGSDGTVMLRDGQAWMFKAYSPNADRQALAESLAGIEFRKAASYADGYAVTVLALKANEAIVEGRRLELKREMFELA